MRRTVCLFVALSGCGLGYRMSAGPTVDPDGHLGFEVHLAGIVYTGQERRVAVVAEPGGGVFDGDSTYRGAVGLDWDVEPGSTWGYRVGGRAGVATISGDAAGAVGLELGFARAVGSAGAATLALGLAAGCEQRFGGENGTPDEICNLDVVFEIVNRWAGNGGPYY